MRNLLLNWMVLIPIIVAALLLPRIVVAVVQMASRTGARVEWALWLGTFFGLAAIVYMGVARPSANRLRKFHEHRLNRQWVFLALCLLPLSLSAMGLTSWWAWRRNVGWALFGAAWPEFLLYGIALHLAGFLLYTLILFVKDAKFWLQRFKLKNILLELLAVALIGSLWGVLSWWVTHSVFETPVSANPVSIPITELYACFAAPIFMAVFLLAVILFVGITSQFTDDEDREWWARFGAWVLIVAVLWSVLSALVIFGPAGLMKLGAGSKVIKAILAALGGASGLLTILGGMSAKTGSHQEQGGKPGGLMGYASMLAAPVFALTLLVAFSLSTSVLIKKFAPSAGWDFANQHALDSNGLLQIIHNSPLTMLLWLAVVLVAVSLIMSTCVNINKFSLHSMYRNRLIRAYLGASRPEAQRRPNPFTGFDPYDNIAMHELRHHQDAPGELKRKLLHVVNICLNLTSGHNLAWQQRKAETFTVSPLHCGNFHLGYRKTEEYGGGSGPPGDGISLGT
ncbi:MAG: hypothetical protein LC747_02745, partial [Acidobacteria bacterium]|nr:hypothetical protein [Acidobacteriota bacterium]